MQVLRRQRGEIRGNFSPGKKTSRVRLQVSSDISKIYG